MGLPENIEWCAKNEKKFVDAQKTEISVCADGDFGEMKKTRRLRPKDGELAGINSVYFQWRQWV